MKKLFLATAVAALYATSAQAAPTLYGAAKAGIHYTSPEKETAGNKADTELKDFGSRFGIKGSSEVANGTKAIYQFEYGLVLDEKSVATIPVFDEEGNPVLGKNGKVKTTEISTGEFAIAKRDAFLGLEDASFGTIKFGRFSTVDGDVNFSSVDPIGFDAFAGGTYDGDRYNNTVQYTTPNLSGLTAGAFYVFDETSAEGKEKDVYGVAATYDADVVKVGASFVDNGDNATFARVSAGTSLSGFDLGVTYQLESIKDVDDSQSTVQLGASYAMDSVTVFGQFDMVSNLGNDKDSSVNRYVGGASFNVVEGTDVHTYVGYTDPTIGKNDKSKNNVLGLGAAVVHSF